MMSYDNLKQSVKEQIKNRAFGGMTIKQWNENNRMARKHLKLLNVRCKTCFYNPNDGKLYIKQSFRNERIGGLVQWTCSMDDVLFRVLDGEDKALQGYHMDDEYFAIPIALVLRRVWG